MMFVRSGYWALSNDEGTVYALVRASNDGHDERFDFKRREFVPLSKPIVELGMIGDWDPVSDDEARRIIGER